MVAQVGSSSFLFIAVLVIYALKFLSCDTCQHLCWLRAGSKQHRKGHRVSMCGFFTVWDKWIKPLNCRLTNISAFLINWSQTMASHSLITPHIAHVMKQRHQIIHLQNNVHWYNKCWNVNLAACLPRRPSLTEVGQCQKKVNHKN
jgi:hypothetical protein